MADAGAWNQGWALGSQRAQEGRAHKQALSDMELEGKINDLIEQKKGLQAKIPAYLDPSGKPKVGVDGQPIPEYQQLVSSLQQNARELKEVYHPDANPTAIARFGHLLTDHLGITHPSQRQGKAAAKSAQDAQAAQQAAQEAVSSAPIGSAQQGQMDTDAQVDSWKAQADAKLKWAINNGVSQGVIEQIKAGIVGAQKEPQERFMPVLQTTTDANGTMHYWRVPLSPDGKPEEVDFNGQTVVPKQSKMTSAQLLQDSYLASIGLPFGTQWDKLTNPQRAGYELYVNHLKQRASNHQTAITDRDGNVHIVDLSGTSGPVDVGSPSRPTASPSTPTGTSTQTPKPPPTGGAKAGGTSVKGDKVLSFQKSTPDFVAADKKYKDAVGLVNFADNVQKQPDNPQEQRDFAIMMERTMSGRFQTAAYDLEVKNSGIANTFEQWLNNFSTGSLPQQIVDHLVQSAHDYKDAMAKELDAAKGTTGNAGGGIPAGATHIFHNNEDNKDYYVDEQGNSFGEVPKQ